MDGRQEKFKSQEASCWGAFRISGLGDLALLFFDDCAKHECREEKIEETKGVQKTRGEEALNL